MAEEQVRQEAKQEAKQEAAQGRKFDGFMAEVVEVAPIRTGMFGSIRQVMLKILDGKDKGRVRRRNVSGRIKVGDIIRVSDTSREDKRIMVR